MMRSENMLLLTASPDLDQFPDRTHSQRFLIPNDVDVDDKAHTAAWNITSGSQSNSSTSSPWNTRDDRLAKVEIAVQAVIFVLAVLGNGFVLLALRYRKRKTSRMHIFITHLSIADLLVAMLNILPQMAWDVTFRFQGGDVVCRVVKYAQVMVIYLSTYVLVMTAVDRYRAICHPLSTRSWTNRKSYLMIALAWLISLVLSVPQLVIFKIQRVDPNTEVTDCWARFQPEWTLRLYITAFSVTVFFLPALILCLLYGRICYVVWRNVYHRTADTPERFRRTSRPQTIVSWPENGLVRYKFTRNGDAPRPAEPGASLGRGRSHGVGGISRAKIKTIKLTIVVIIAYLMCWAPFIITQMWWAYDESAPYNSSTFVICLLLASLNSCCNPWIYMAFSESLVQEICPCFRGDARNKPPVHNNQRERARFTPATPRADNAGASDDEEKLHPDENIPLQDRVRIDDQRRVMALLSRGTSTKWSTLHGTESRSSRQNMTASRERAQMTDADWLAAPTYQVKAGQYACSSKVAANRPGTKSCQCKKCVESMEDKEIKKGFLMTWRERTDESSKSSSSSSRRRRDRDGKKHGKQSPANGRLIRSPKSSADDSLNLTIEKVKFSSM